MSRRFMCLAVVVLALSMVPALATPCFTPGNIFITASKLSQTDADPFGITQNPADPTGLIVEFTPQGEFVRYFNSNGRERDMQFRDKFHLYATAYGSFGEFLPDGTESRSLSVGAHGIGIGPDGHVYAASRGGNVVTDVDTWQPTLTPVGSFSTGVTGDNTFDVAASSDGKFYVAHYGSKLVNRYDSSGTLEASAATSSSPHAIAIRPDESLIAALSGSVHRFDADLNPLGDVAAHGRLFMNYGERGNTLYVGTHSQNVYRMNDDGSDYQVIVSGASNFTFGNSLYRSMSAQPAPGSGWHMLVSTERWAGGSTPCYSVDGGAVFEFDETGSLIRVLNETSTGARGMGSIDNRYVAVNHGGLKVLDTSTGIYVASGGSCDGVNVGSNGLIYTAVRGSKLVKEYQFDPDTQVLTLLRTLSTQPPAVAGSGTDTIDVVANDEYFYVGYYPRVVQQYRLSDGGFVREYISSTSLSHGITIDPRTGNVVSRGTGGDVYVFDPDTLGLLTQAAWSDYTTFIGYGPDDLLYTAGSITGGDYIGCGQIRVGTPGQSSWIYIGPEEFVYNGRHYRAADVAFYYVPEPTTLGLLALGGLALVRRRRQS